MPKLSSSRMVNFPAEKLFRAVLDIESYPRILGFVRDVRILRREKTTLEARVSVGLPMLAFSYDCLIEFEENRSIKVTLLSGPFRRLHALWRFEAQSDHRCLVHYALDSEFSNPLMELTAGAIFARQLDHSITAFEEVLKRS